MAARHRPLTAAEFAALLPPKPTASDIRAAIDRARSAPVPAPNPQALSHLPTSPDRAELHDLPTSPNPKALADLPDHPEPGRHCFSPTGLNPENPPNRPSAAAGAKTVKLRDSFPRSKWSVFRERQRRGQIVLNVVVDEHDLAATAIAAGYLSEREALDRRRLEAATTLIVKDWCEWWRGRTR